MLTRDQARRNSAISAVLPLALSRRGGIGDLRRCDILLSSLAHFTEPGLFDQLLVVVPRKDYRAVSDCIIRHENIPITVVIEDDILPQFRAFPEVGGWHRQQIIKLFAANIVDTEFYLTLDSDAVLCKPLGFDQLIIDGRALIEPLARSFYPRWWPGSANVLGVVNDPDAPGMSVTPALLSVTVCQQLHRDIEERHNRNWVDVLLEQAQAHLREPASVLGWTEYTLYYLTLERHGAVEQFHRRPEPGEPHLLRADSVWYPEEAKNLDMSKYFGNDDSGLFAVFQSTSGLPIPRLKAEIQKHLILAPLPLAYRLARLRWQVGTATGIQNMAWKILTRSPKAFRHFAIRTFAGGK